MRTDEISGLQGYGVALHVGKMVVLRGDGENNGIQIWNQISPAAASKIAATETARPNGSKARGSISRRSQRQVCHTDTNTRAGISATVATIATVLNAMSWIC